MGRNRTLLDEAARSVRRTFIGSLAGTVSMLAVIGAAGAYGMPERLSAQALSNALATLQVKFSTRIEFADDRGPVAHAPVERANAERGPSYADASRRPTSAMPMPEDVVAPAATEIRSDPVSVSSVAPADAAPAAPAAVPAFSLASLPPVPAAPPAVVPPAEAMGNAIAKPDPIVPDNPADLTRREPLPESAADRPQEPEAPSGDEPQAGGAASSAPVEVGEPEAKPEPAVGAGAAAVRNSKGDVVVNSIDKPKTVWVHLPLPKAPLTPAQRLSLHGADYERAERCLAKAVYFEARNQPLRGQMAVAQVVLNRVFSPYYPNDICSVVYQNAHRHLSCQFTFACDGKSKALRERGAWARAQRIARQSLEAKIWLPEVAKATHYHAAYVRPYWIRDMKVMARFGLHTFYRPRIWGDGHNEPAWGAGAVKKDRVL